jgi:DNA-directed RNA polymerase specialized sigma24 family protein
MPDENTESSAAMPGQFPATHWSVVLAAVRNDDTRSHQALTQLCQVYWFPLYAFVRRHGHSPEDAQDFTQGFFAHLLERQALAEVDRAKGKFRSFLLASLRNFLTNERERGQAQKRGGGHAPIRLDAATAETRYRLEPADHASPDKVFERNWALALLEQVLGRLRAEQAAAGKGAQFERLQPTLMADPDAPAYAGLAAGLGLSEDAARMSVYRLRRRYRELLREEIAQTVSSPAETEEELRHLFAVLGR